MTSKKYLKLALSLATAIVSLSLLADAEAARAAKRFATGGVVTSFHYVTNGVGYTAFVHTFTNTAEAAEFRNRAGKPLPVRLLAVGGGGAGMEGMRSILSSTRYPGGGGGGGGGVTETNTFLSADDVWTIRVGAGGTISSRGYDKARGAAGTSSVSNGFVEVVSVPGGGAGGSRSRYPTVGAAGGGGSGAGTEYAAGAEGNYTNSVGGVLYGPYKGGWGGTIWESSYGGGGGGAGANGAGATGGEGLTNDISGVSVVYGSGGGGGGHCRVDRGVRRNGGEGGTNAGNGGNCEWDIVDDGATTNIVVTIASAPIANTGAGGAGGVSFGGGANYSDYGGAYVYATPGADGVVIVRYDIPDTPCVGGDVVTVTTNGYKVTYIHTFTNTTEAATFTPSVAFDGTSVRLLAVGGGGAGMDGLKNHNVSSAARYGGGGGGGGGVTETNALLSVGDVWTVRVGAGGGIPSSHSSAAARYEAGASSVSNGVVELVSVPGGGAGGSMSVYPTEGAAGGGGSRNSNDTSYGFGTNGTYRSFTFKVSEGMPVGPFKGGDSSTSSSRGAAGGGGGAGEAGNGKKGGEGLVSDITGTDVTYGSGGGGGGMVRVRSGSSSQGATSGGNGGDGAGYAGGCELRIEDGGAKTNLYFTSVTAPLPNRGGGGAGGASFNNLGDDVYVDDEPVTRSASTVHCATEGADGVVIIRYEADLPHPKGFMFIVL